MRSVDLQTSTIRLDDRDAKKVRDAYRSIKAAFKGERPRRGFSSDHHLEEWHDRPALLDAEATSIVLDGLSALEVRDVLTAINEVLAGLDERRLTAAFTLTKAGELITTLNLRPSA